MLPPWSEECWGVGTYMDGKCTYLLPCRVPCVPLFSFCKNWFSPTCVGLNLRLDEPKDDTPIHERDPVQALVPHGMGQCPVCAP